MMKTNLLSACAVLLAVLVASCHPSPPAANGSAYPPMLTEQEFKANPSLMGSIFAVYPGPGMPTAQILTGEASAAPALTPAPEGYEPFYISHYGRHGSRFQGSEKRYVSALRRLQVADSLHNLTPYGQQLLPQLTLLREYARGNGGQLSTIGVAQHHDLAQRMYHNFPEVFQPGTSISARSSVVSRCRASMLSFTGSLLECDSTLSITAETDSAFMQYIANDTPELKALDCDTAFWYPDYGAYARQHLSLGRLMDTLFVHPEGLDSLMTFAELYYLAVGMEDLDLPQVELSGLFTPQELFDAFRCINYRMYMCNGACPRNQGIPQRCAHNLLHNIINSADSALSDRSVTLRFGHDSHLLRLLALMSVHNAANQETDPERYWCAWQSSVLSPMAANLQLIFYRKSQTEASSQRDEVLVKLLLNENEVLLDGDIQPLSGPYYRWSDLRAFWLSRMQ